LYSFFLKKKSSLQLCPVAKCAAISRRKQNYNCVVSPVGCWLRMILWKNKKCPQLHDYQGRRSSGNPVVHIYHLVLLPSMPYRLSHTSFALSFSINDKRGEINELHEINVTKKEFVGPYIKTDSVQQKGKGL
jgi:hypothetical protein